MATCPTCGQDNPDGFLFCGSCGSPMTAEAPAPREERKVVTVLFADLVGFTQRAEQMDPEDVRALLSPYYAHLRAELERFGGTVEKFIGDAVMGLFGAPVAHEDDPERAVRAALSIRDWAQAQPGLQVRIAVNTGEALVALGARPSEGEGMASGDVVNSAARLQTTAPLNGVLVGEQTYRATRDAIDYRQSASVTVKGKQKPLAVWEALQARARIEAQTARAPLVGRRDELELLRSLLHRAHRERAPQMVTLVGVPGIGKSRLLAELYASVEAEPDGVTWRQGRSLPYGEGVTFWALGEIVKAQAGILESDDVDAAAQKLAGTVRDLLSEGEAGWVEAHLRPLVGVGAGQELVGTKREEAFAAWRRFFEAIAERGITVFTVEDLHWADEGLLEFVDYLVEWTSGVPLLVVCTARPELLARRPEWGGGKTNALTLALSPLSDEETTHLVHALLEQAVLPADLQQSLVERAGGNPLYAEEFARLVAEQGSGVDAVQALPETVQGIIAARLDALASEEKAFLQNAAVVGKVFWVAAVCSMGDMERDEAEEHLHALERKDFVRRARSTSVEDETEYAFRHILLRDVAYSQIPRAERAEKHRLTAEWIGSLGRPEDHAEMLAHHYLTALELNRAAGKDDPALGERARSALRDAGDRAMALAAYEQAVSFYASALELCPIDDPERPHLLLRQGRASYFLEASGLELLTEALEAFRAIGDEEGAAEAATAAGQLLWYRGERDPAYAYVDEALELLSLRPDSPAKANALLRRSAFHLTTGEFPETLALVREALPMVERLGLDAQRARALNLIGWARVGIGDPEGLRDLEQAVEIAQATNAFEHLHSSFENLRSAQFALGQLEEAGVTARRYIESAGRGTQDDRRWVHVLRAGEAFRGGRWDEALGLAETFLDAVEAGSPHYLEPVCRNLRSSIRLARGDVRAAAGDAARSVEAARRTKDEQVLSNALLGQAIVALAEDGRGEASALASELEGMRATVVFALTFGSPTPADFAWLMRSLERRQSLLRLLDAVPLATPWVDACRAIADDDFVRAAETLGRIGHLPGEAEARLRAAETLAREGRRAEGDAQLAHALEFYRAVGATAYVRRGEALLAASA